MKRLLHSCTALTLSLAFTTAAIAQEPLKELGAGEGEVSIVAWAGYIERGETDKNYDWVTEFEKKTSCKVTVKTAATSTIATTAPNSVPIAGSINQAKMMPATAKNGTGNTS